ncbi:MAG: hypothetical protein ACR2N6_06465 [Miltoncostaeaceae bacterium]
MSDERFIEEPDFRTLAAPGLDEDELYAALQGLPGRGALWGEGRSQVFPPAERHWDTDGERHKRHREVLERWPKLDQDDA